MRGRLGRDGEARCLTISYKRYTFRAADVRDMKPAADQSNHIEVPPNDIHLTWAFPARAGTAGYRLASLLVDRDRDAQLLACL